MKRIYYIIGVGVALISFIFFREIVFSNECNNNYSVLTFANTNWVDENSGIILEFENEEGVMYFENDEYDIGLNVFQDSIKIFYKEDQSKVFFNAKIERLDKEFMVLVQYPDTIFFTSFTQPRTKKVTN